MTKSQDAIQHLFKVDRDATGDVPPLSGIFPDYLAPVVRKRNGQRELTMMRWGFPPPPAFPASQMVTNVRNTTSSYWRSWLTPEWRCVVPATSFCEWTDSRPKVTHWFAIDESRTPFAFAGIWRPWTGVCRGDKTGESREHQLFCFLTCAANDLVRPIHAKEMPVVLTLEDEWDRWLTAPVDEALQLQRPLPSEILKIVAKDKREDASVQTF